MPQRLVEIAGAGFAGLTAAAAFAQGGWSVRVHERAPECREFGAGIWFWENGVRVSIATENSPLLSIENFSL